MRRRGLELCMGILLLAGALFLSREAVQVMNSGQREPLIVVDAGHGGIDPGMVGIGDLLEKDVNLAVCLKLKKCLLEAGCQVILTRETDAGLYDEDAANKKVQDLQRRCGLIAEKEPDLTVSVHQNSYEDASVCGPQVFYYAGSPDGEALAECLQTQLNEQLQVEKPRRAKGNSSYYLLKKSRGVLVIAECGFLTNPEESEKLQTEEYQQKIARALCDGITGYLEGKQSN